MKVVSLAELPQHPVSHNPKIEKQVMIERGELDPITHFSQAIFPPGEIAYAHAHRDMAEVFFVRSGQGIIRINRFEYQLLPGSCILVEPNEVHEIQNTSQDALVLVYFGVQL